ncbi:MAG: sugar phosphate nucleotidyltransferase [Thermodesulfobacteriota bacterium]
MQAMILAAGFGTRLLPYTRYRPKPLFPVLNHPLLLLTIHRLQRAGFDRIVVNCHYLAEQIIEAVTDIEGVIVQHEMSVLGTGGGLRMACEHFNDEPLLVTNGDIYHTVDYTKLYESHTQNSSPVTLGMHDYPRFNSVRADKGMVAGFDREGDEKLLAFSGLHVLEPRILTAISPGIESCIIDCYRNLLPDESIDIFRMDDCFWTDMGSLDDYLALHGGLLTGNIPLWDELENEAHDPFLTRGQLEKEVRLEDWVCIGDARIGRRSHLQRSVVWDGAELPENTDVIDQLVARAPLRQDPCQPNEND